MKIVRYKEGKDGAVHCGVIVDDRVKRIQGDIFCAHTVEADAGKYADLTLLSPCVPGKVVALAANYRGATGVTETMSEPVVFVKPAGSVIGPQESIVSPFKDVNVWGEAELAIVVGKRLRNASLQQAHEAIFGYTCANDVTAENVEGRDHHLVRSKGADSFCPLGPWIDTAFNPADALILAYQNGIMIRRGNLKDRIWKDEHTLQWLSLWMTLDPGDVVLTGTPPRVTEKTFLQDGDIFTVDIQGLGKMSNRFERRVAV
jgi:2-keto-4-pentenoate hydratase/2-oxohepta-3-ene-1,7-dioic acid hydratase in catechol pathway